MSNVELALCIEINPGTGIAGNRTTHSTSARRLMVSQTPRMSNLMRSQIARSLPDHLLDAWVAVAALALGRKKRVGDQIVLTVAQRTKRIFGFDDLTRSRPHHASAVREAANGPMNPLDHVVTDIHGGCAGGKHFDL